MDSNLEVKGLEESLYKEDEYFLEGVRQIERENILLKA